MINGIFPIIRASKQWDEQANLLSTIQFSEDNIKQLNTPKNCEVLRKLFENPRSKLITITTQFLLQVFENYGPLVHNLAINLLGTGIMFKLLSSPNKVIANTIHELIKTIVVHCPHSKFYAILASEFNNCKSHNVRQNISTYFLVLVDSIKWPNNFGGLLKLWESDANPTVRKNIQLLRQIVDSDTGHHHQTSKQTRQNRQPLHEYNQTIKQKSVEEEESIKQQFISDSFLCGQSFYTPEDDVQFLISKIQSKMQLWNAKYMAIEQLCKMVDENRVPLEKYQAVIQILVQYLDERKNKAYNLVYKPLKLMLSLKEQFLKYLQTHPQTIIKKSLITPQIAKYISQQLLSIDSIKFLIIYTQMAHDTKSIKSKIVLLDILAEQFCKEQFEEGKVGTVVKILCEIIIKSQNNREVFTPCMVILSHFRALYPKELLSCLFMEGNQVIKKIIGLAEQIDPQLREGILLYLHEFKHVPQIMYPHSHRNTSIKQKPAITSKKIEPFSFPNNDRANNTFIQESSSIQQCYQGYFSNSYEENQTDQDINYYLQDIRQQENEQAVQELAKFIFKKFNQITSSNFREIIKLTQLLTSENLLMDLELLLEQLCKIESAEYLDGLFIAIEECDIKTIQKQYVRTYIEKIAQISKNFRHLIHENYTDRILKIYRAGKCPKLRMTCIKFLMLLDENLYEELATDKQKQLIRTYQNKYSHPNMI